MSSDDDATVASIRMKWFLGPIATWVLALVTIFAFPRDLPEITGLAILLFPLIGLILLVAFTVAVFRSKERRPAVIAILLVMLIGVAYRAGGVQWGARLHLLINRSWYLADFGD